MSEALLDALVLGHLGQDGILLRERLDAVGQSWVGVSTTAAAASEGRRGGWYDITDREAVRACIAGLRPKQVFYLSAAHGGSSDAGGEELGERYRRELSVNTMGLLHHLEAIHELSPETRLVFASSSLVFAPTDSPDQRITEETPLAPSEPYGLQKALAGLACRDYRRRHGLFACVAFLFNHESIHRREGYFTSQIVAGIRRILAGEEDHLEVGNLEAIVDWSFAGDVVQGMLHMLAGERPRDYVVASGEAHTVRDFLEIAFAEVRLDMQAHIKLKPGLLKRTNSCRVGDARLLRESTGWEPKMPFEDLVRHLLRDRR